MGCDQSQPTRFVLRLGASTVAVNGHSIQPVWVGSVVDETLTRPLWLFTVADVDHDANGPRDEALKVLPVGQMSAGIDASAGWDGKVWLGTVTP